jgi:acetyl esterase/lipase
MHTLLAKPTLVALIILAIGFSTRQQTPSASPSETATPDSLIFQSFAINPPAGSITLQASMRVYKDIPYQQIAGVDPNLLSLDIYTPISYGTHPVIVMIHGGGWRGGQKDTLFVAGIKSQFFTSKNIVFVSINYRLSPNVIHPVHVEDVAAALAWVYLHIPDYGGDPRYLYVMGHSSGAHLAALVATDERFLSLNGMRPNIIRGVILLDAAGLDIPGTMSPSFSYMYTTAFGTNPDIWADASPSNHVAPGKGIPPFLICVASQIPAFSQSSQQFAIKLNAAGIPVRLVIALDETHSSINDDIGTLFDPVTEYIISFVRATISPTRPPCPCDAD